MDGDRIRTGVARDGSVDVHWLELWPQVEATGPRYADLLREIRRTRALAPDNTGIVASYYPQNPPYEEYPLLPTGWPAPNVQYNYATAFAAGSSWGSHSVAGHGSFTQVLPFKFAYLGMDRLRLLRTWNGFMAAYGPYYAWDSAIYRFQLLNGPTSLGEHQHAVAPLLYRRQRLADGRVDAYVLHLINYGPNTNWADVAGEPQSIDDLAIQFPLDRDTRVHRVFVIEPGRDIGPLPFSQADSLALTLPRLEYYALIVAELSSEPTLPQPLPAVPELDAYAPEPYDTGGNALWERADQISMLDEVPIFAITTLDVVTDDVALGDFYLTDEDAYSGRKSYCVSDCRVKVTATQRDALRFNLNNFPVVSFAWKSVDAAGLTVTFEILNMDTGDVAEVTYFAGQAGRSDAPALSLGPIPREWQCVRRNVKADVLDTAWGADWHNAAVIALTLGATGKAYFDAVKAERTPDWVLLHIRDVHTRSGETTTKAGDLQGVGTVAAWRLQGRRDVQWLEADLGSSQLVCRIDVACVVPRGARYEIQWSNDSTFMHDSTYDVVEDTDPSVIGGAAEDDWRVHRLAHPIHARYLRLQLDAHTSASKADVKMRVLTR